MDDTEMIIKSYHFQFIETGVPAVDNILNAVATAGRCFHHTSHWQKNVTGNPNDTPEDWIQRAANDAAEVVKRLDDQLTELIVYPNE